MRLVCCAMYYSNNQNQVIIFAGQPYASVEETLATEEAAQARAVWLNEASEIASEISDVSKSLNGFRARFDWKNWTLDQLRDELRSYHNNLRQQNAWEEESKRDRDAQKVRECNARALRKREFERSFNSLGNALAAL